MNQAVRDWVIKIVRQHRGIIEGGVVVEVGSRDFNGSIRNDVIMHGEPDHYIGIDRNEGKGVDKVLDGKDLPVSYTGGGVTDAVICCEALEHESEPAELIRIMYMHLRVGGLLILTTRGIGYPPHDEPEDYWRFTQHALARIIKELSPKAAAWGVKDDPENMGVYAYAVRGNR